jgi:hypothetical protein
MFSSKFSQRLWKWLCAPKKFKSVFLVRVKVGKFQNEYIRMETEVIAHNKRQAKELAYQEIKKQVFIEEVSTRSLGKVYSFNNELHKQYGNYEEK